MRDRYKHWYDFDDSSRAPIRPIMKRRYRDLEDLVLEDLAKAQNDEEKIEILDSYSLANQRKYRNELYQFVLDIGQRLFVKMLGPAMKLNLPEPQPPYHPYVGVAAQGDPTAPAKEF